VALTSWKDATMLRSSSPSSTYCVGSYLSHVTPRPRTDHRSVQKQRFFSNLSTPAKYVRELHDVPVVVLGDVG
jgi:hypothetical protein